MAPPLDQAAVDSAAARIGDELVALRRSLHRHPELAGHERRTAALVAERLRAAGLDVTTGVGGHGVVAVLDGAAAGPTVAYRADMDAVPEDERQGGDFASRVPGAAHLCGHDLHTAIGVGVATVLAGLRHRLRGRLVFLFQPAEETLAGARAMIADGVLDRTAPQEIYALHCGQLPAGTFAVMPGAGHPGQDELRVELTGPTAEADGRRLAALVAGLGTVDIPQTPRERDRLLADLMTPDGPLARFVYVRSYLDTTGGRTQLRAWLRAWPDSAYTGLREQVGAWVDELPGARLTFTGAPFPSMVCSPALSEAAAVHLRAVLGPDAVTVVHAAYPYNSEDFALYLQRVPGAMFFLGVADPAAGLNGIPHHPDFGADESAIGAAVRAMPGFLAARLTALG